MPYFSNNLKKIRIERGITQKKLADALHVSQNAVFNWENGKREPALEMIKKIADALEVDPFTLYSFDMASKVLETGINQKENKLLNNYRQLNDAGQEKAIDQVELLTKIPEYRKEYAEKAKERTLQRNAHTSNIRLINYYYRLASAGTGQIVFDMPPTDKIEIPDIPEYKKVDYAIGVNGNSMEPEYSDGDILLIEMTEDIDTGEIGIFIVDNESFVKKLGNKELISLNPDYKNIPLTEDSKCMGKVVDKLQNNNF